MACGNSVLWRILTVLRHGTGCWPGPKVTGPARAEAASNETGLASATLRVLTGGKCRQNSQDRPAQPPLNSVSAWASAGWGAALNNTWPWRLPYRYTVMP